METELDFGVPAAAGSVAVYSQASLTAMVLGVLIVFGMLVAATAWLALAGGPGRPALRLWELPPSQRALATMALVSILLVQAVGGLSAYHQTQVVHGSTLEYFQYLSWTKLLGMSHSHIFGFFVVYGVLSFLLSLSDASERTKVCLASLALWAGLFDVASWWGIKVFSPSFHWISIATGTASGLVSLLALYFVGKSLWPRRRA